MRNRICPEYLSYFFGLPAFQEYIRAIAVGATMPSINTTILSEVPIPYPPQLSEQKAIAHILGTLDDKIELNRKKSETLEAIARALFKSWFVDFDSVRAKMDGRWKRGESLPGMPADLWELFPDKLVDSELGEIPEGWMLGKIADLCTAIYSGGTPRTKEPAYWNGGIPWLSSGETRDFIITGTDRTITELGVSQSSTREAPAFSTVIASAGQGSTRGQTALLAFNSYINQSVVALIADPDSSSPSHLFYNLEKRYDEFRRISDAHSSRGSLTTKLLADIDSVIPSRRVIDPFEMIAGDLTMRCIRMKYESETLSDLRDTLLPKLISGEIRVRQGIWKENDNG